ncbi:MAG: Na+/H+ antiporter [Solirubrobacteraceae bacterium]
MLNIEIFIGLLAGVALLAAIAERVGLPHPAVLVLGGLLLGLIPGLPTVHLEPRLVFLGLLPPLVYAAAFKAASFDLRAQATHILTLSTVLVALTVVAAAVVGHLVAGLPWVAAVTLGALVAPTDPVSASSVLRAVGAPDRILAILEGESLVNDGTGLAIFQVAVAAAAGGSISVGHEVWKFVLISVGGVAIGLVGGWLLVKVRSRFDDPTLEIVLGLLAAFGPYTAASAVGCSGVLAAVATGVYAGRQAEDMSSAETRLRVEPFWDALTFVLESVLFLLIGLQLRSIASGLNVPLGTGIAEGIAIVAAVFAVRALWMVALRGLRPVLGRLAPSRAEPLSSPELTVLGFSGMRGALSLAGALSIPVLVSGHPFPARDEVIFVVYVVVIGTLLGPSLTLEPLIRRLGLATGEQVQQEEIRARARVIHAGLARLEELAGESDVPEEAVARLRELAELRLQRLDARAHRGEDDGDRDDIDSTVLRLRREIIAQQRRTIGEMRDQRAAPAQVLARIQRDIDLDEVRLH